MGGEGGVEKKGEGEPWGHRLTDLPHEIVADFSFFKIKFN